MVNQSSMVSWTISSMEILKASDMSIFSALSVDFLSNSCGTSPYSGSKDTPSGCIKLICVCNLESDFQIVNVHGIIAWAVLRQISGGLAFCIGGHDCHLSY